ALCARLVALHHVDPHEAFRSRQQALDIGPAVLFHGRRRNPANLRGTAVCRLNRARLGSLHGHGSAQHTSRRARSQVMVPCTRGGTVSVVLELAEVTVAKKGRAGDDTTEMKLHATDVSGGDGAPKPGRL